MDTTTWTVCGRKNTTKRDDIAGCLAGDMSIGQSIEGAFGGTQKEHGSYTEGV